MTDLTRLEQLLEEEKFAEASGLCPLEEAKEMAYKGSGAAAFAVAAYYYHGLGVKQSIGATFKYCEMADNLGYGKAKTYRKLWEKEEVSKDIIGMVTFFEMFICIPAVLVLGIYFIGDYTDYNDSTKLALYISLIAPIAAIIWLMRFMLKHVNVGQMKVNFLGYLLPIFAIPLTLLCMAAIYAVFFFAAISIFE